MILFKSNDGKLTENYRKFTLIWDNEKITELLTLNCLTQTFVASSIFQHVQNVAFWYLSGFSNPHDINKELHSRGITQTFSYRQL